MGQQVNTMPEPELDAMQLRILACQIIVSGDFPDLDLVLSQKFNQPALAPYVNSVREQLMNSR